jgi:OmpR-family two-component system manganese-sensing response regulator
MVSVAHTASTARSMLAASTYDVLLLDMTVPGLDGLDLCRQLRTQGLTLPVLIVHERGTMDDLVDGFDAGADAYVLGPYTPNVLFAELGDLLRREDPSAVFRPAWSHE